MMMLLLATKVGDGAIITSKVTDDISASKDS